MDITFDLTTSDGKPVEAFSKIIEARRRELGETTKQSCVALAQTILRALRVQTKTAKENEMDIEVTLADSSYYPSFLRDKGAKGKNVSKRVLRKGKNGPVVEVSKVVWALDKYYKNLQAHAYEVKDTVSTDKVIQYVIVAENFKKAMKTAKQTHKNRVKRFKGLARLAIGVAMKRLYDNSGSAGNGSFLAKKVADENVQTLVQETGFSSGLLNIHVHDKLDYAVLALQNGQASVNTALENAMKRVIGYLQQKIKQNGGSIDKPLDVKASDIVGKAAQ